MKHTWLSPQLLFVTFFTLINVGGGGYAVT
jgi:hypothetical protein